MEKVIIALLTNPLLLKRFLPKQRSKGELIGGQYYKRISTLPKRGAGRKATKKVQEGRHYLYTVKPGFIRGHCRTKVITAHAVPKVGVMTLKNNKWEQAVKRLRWVKRKKDVCRNQNALILLMDFFFFFYPKISFFSLSKDNDREVCFSNGCVCMCVSLS